jgi:hypothetical protein
MRALSQADCVALWESGQALHPLDQGLLAIQTAFPETRGESLADWPLGRKNRALAELRCSCFGRWLRGWTGCDSCGEKIEFAVDGEAISRGATPESQTTVQVGNRTFRLPTTRDLSKIAFETDSSLAASRLLEMLCVLPSAEGEQATGLSPRSSNEELDAAGEKLAEADPLTEILVHFDCPACSHSFDQALDLTQFLWSEIEGRAKRLLLDVCTLAGSFGWSERDILSMSTTRRDFYLQMVRG